MVYGTRPGGSFDWPTRTTRYDGTTETLFAVEWPLLRTEYRPLWPGRDDDLGDEAAFRGEASNGNRAVYIFLPDGRIDLLSCDERFRGTSFNCGYGGTGPDILEIAICRAVRLQRERSKSTYDQFRQWLKDPIERRHRKDQPLEISVGLLCAKLQQLRALERE